MAKGKYEYWLSKEGLLLLQGWARDGLIDTQIAHNMDIAVATLYAWKNQYSDISEALKKGKEVADYEVENALHKRATGFTQLINGKEVYYPPDTTACMYWTSKRMPKKWAEKQGEDLDNGKLSELIQGLKNNG